MKLSTTYLGIAFVCAASALGAAAIPGTQTPEKQTPAKQTPEKQTPEKATAVPASMPKVQPTREHAELLKLVGTWDSTMTMMKPGAPAQTSKATLVYKPVGELWVASEISGEMMGTPWDPLESTCRHASLSIL